jgi:hypothetical protein
MAGVRDMTNYTPLDKKKFVIKYKPICTALSHIPLHYDPDGEGVHSEIGKMAFNAVKWGKWTVDNLVRYKEENEQKTIYLADEESMREVENLRNFDYENTPIPSATDERYILLDKCLELHKKFTESGLEHRSVKHHIDHAVGSAYALTKRLNYYINKFGPGKLRTIQEYKEKYKDATK